MLRDAENAELQGETGCSVSRVSERWGGKDERPTFPSERRTVIWHACEQRRSGPHSNSQNAVRRSRLPSCMLADSGVLDDAGVIRKVHLSRDRVRKRATGLTLLLHGGDNPRARSLFPFAHRRRPFDLLGGVEY